MHPLFRGSRKASQGCAPWSAVQNETGGELHGPSPHPRLLVQGSSTALLGHALLANLWGRASPRGPSRCSIIPRQIIRFARCGHSGTQTGSVLAR